MRQKIILSSDPLEKESFTNFLKDIGKEYNYRIEKEDLYNLDDIDFYKDISEDEIYFMGFWIIKEETFGRDWFEAKGDQYANCLFITHDSDILTDLNIIIKRILENYPDLIVTDELYKDFYSIKDIESGDVAPWLLAE